MFFLIIIATPTEEKLVIKVVLPVLSAVILALLGTPAICIVIIIKLRRKKGLKVHVVAIVMTWHVSFPTETKVLKCKGKFVPGSFHVVHLLHNLLLSHLSEYIKCKLDNMTDSEGKF